MNTYRNNDEANQDKTQLTELLDALHAWPSALRRDDAATLADRIRSTSQ
jgi:hypothetical protein